VHGSNFGLMCSFDGTPFPTQSPEKAEGIWTQQLIKNKEISKELEIQGTAFENKCLFCLQNFVLLRVF